MGIRVGLSRWWIAGVALVVVAVGAPALVLRSSGGAGGDHPVTGSALPAASAAVGRGVIPGSGSSSGTHGATAGPATAEARRAAEAREAATAAAWARLPTTGWIATLRTTTSWSARPGGPVAGTLPALTRYASPDVVALVGPPGRDGWARVELPVRPNGSTGWIRWRPTRLQRTTYRIAVDLATRTLAVLDGSTTVLTTPVAVGTPRTPTPAGRTYVWELVRPADPDGAYGPDILGLALYSDAYSVFNGGEAQIGIHGSDDPASIGQAASNGCIRLPDAVVARLTGIVPLGTPVTITG